MNEVKIPKKDFLEMVEKYMDDVMGLENYCEHRLVYYALIELPSGRHVPLPIALREKIVSSKDLEKIPLSRKRRDNKFYTRPCGAYSFFKCPYWNEKNKDETKIKLLALQRLIREGQHKKLRLVIPSIYKDETGGLWGAWEFDRACEYVCENCPFHNAWEHDSRLCRRCKLYKMW